MEISGKVIDILDLKRGNGKNGEWRKQDFVIETGDQYPKKVCISMWGDKIDQFSPQVGEQVTVSINIESREYNGNWYTDVRAWKLDKNGPSSEAAPIPQDSGLESDGEDPGDLPF
ncbi:MAG: DUF3127 domain-containing protein [Luteibaculum sp.]